MGSVCFNYCPGKEAALVSIVVSLTCTAYQCGALIALCEMLRALSHELRAVRHVTVSATGVLIMF